MKSQQWIYLKEYLEKHPKAKSELETLSITDLMNSKLAALVETSAEFSSAKTASRSV